MKLNTLAFGYISILFVALAANSNSSDNNNTVLIQKNSTEDYFMAISDIHYDHTVSGDIQRWEDTGIKLWGRTKVKIEEMLSGSPAPKFVVLLGDLPGHSKCAEEYCNYINSDVKTDIGTVLGDLSSIMSKYKMPLFYLPGNNDAQGGDYHSFTYCDSSTIYKFDTGGEWPALNMGTGFNQASLIDNQQGLGYYSAYPLGKRPQGTSLRLIAMNTIMFSKGCPAKNECCYIGDDGVPQGIAATRQLDWLEKQLSEARSSGDSVMIMMHIPPGITGYNNAANWSTDSLYRSEMTLEDRFVEVVNDYEDIITVILNSHSHLNTVKRIYGDNKRVSELVISVPGVTPSHGNNPGMRTFTYESSGYNLTEILTFYTTKNAPTKWGNDQLSFRKDFNVNVPFLIPYLKSLDHQTISGYVKKEYNVGKPCPGCDWIKVSQSIEINP